MGINSKTIVSISPLPLISHLNQLTHSLMIPCV